MGFLELVSQSFCSNKYYAVFMSVSRKRAQKENKLSASEHEMKRERNRQRQVERSQKVIIRVGQPADRYWGDVLLFRCD